MKRSAVIIIFVVAAIILGTGYSLWNYASTPEPLVLSGVIEADDIHVGSKIAGRVLKVVAREGETVNAGEPLVLLEPNELDAAMAQAQARLHEAQAKYSLLTAGYRKEEIEQAEAAAKQARAEVEQLLAGTRRQEIEQANADWTAAKARAEDADRSLKRAEDLSKRDLIARQEYMSAVAYAANAERQLKAARERRERLLSARPEEAELAKQRLAEADAKLRQMRGGYRKEEIAQAKSALEAARAKLQVVRAQLDETVIKAPADALVETLQLEAGDLVSAGKVLATLVRTGSLWVNAYLPQAQLRFVQPGTKAKVRVDTYPDVDFTGIVRRVHREDEPNEGALHEDHALQVFQAEVAIADPDHMLRPGMNADVTLLKTSVRANAQSQQKLQAN
jgi:HlyD family secretion protein